MDNITFRITDKEAELVLAALAELPLKVSAPLYSKLNEQRKQQENGKALDETIEARAGA